MDLIYSDRDFKDIGVLKNPQLDLAFGRSENNFECKIPLADACCDKGFLIYAEGTEYGGIVDNIGIDTRNGIRNAIYSGRTWHGILGSKCILPLQKGEATGGGKKLPDGCTLLEYIASTGTQRLNTGIKPNQNTTLHIKFSTSHVDGGCLAACDAGWQSSGFGIWCNAIACGSSSLYPTDLINDGKIHEMTLSGDAIAYDHGVQIWSGTKTSFASQYDLPLLCLNRSGSFSEYIVAKLYACQIYDNKTLVRDYVPILDPSGVACLYDYVNEEYCYNAGTGSFIAGYKIPEGYTEREYIESHGAQFIDTEFAPNQDTRVVATMQCVPDGTSNYAFGARRTTTTMRYFFICSRDNYYQSGYGSTPLSISEEYNQSGMFEVDKDKNVVKINGVTVATAEAETFQTPCNMYIFAVNTNGTKNYGKIRVGKFQVYDNVIPVRDYVSVTDASGIAGMFDRIGNKTYYNAGSGSFTAGAAVEISENEPDETIDAATGVTVEGKTDSGESLIDRYLIISGDANACIEYVVNRIGLPSSLFVPSAEESGVMVEKYQFERYTDAYTGLCDMLASVGMRLSIVHENGVVQLAAVPAIDYSQSQEFEAALIPYETKAYKNKPNHLVCLGSGELENRIVVHLYMDADGNISQTPTFTGIDDYTVIFDYPNAAGGEDVTEEEQIADLIASGTEKFIELQTADEIDIDFDIADDAYYIGDIIGTYDQETDLFVSAVIFKKIVTVKNGRVTVNYNEG